MKLEVKNNPDSNCTTVSAAIDIRNNRVIHFFQVLSDHCDFFFEDTD
jgi:hypothetical protein